MNKKIIWGIGIAIIVIVAGVIITIKTSPNCCHGEQYENNQFVASTTPGKLSETEVYNNWKDHYCIAATIEQATEHEYIKCSDGSTADLERVFIGDLDNDGYEDAILVYSACKGKVCLQENRVWLNKNKSLISLETPISYTGLKIIGKASINNISIINGVASVDFIGSNYNGADTQQFTVKNDSLVTIIK